MDYFDALTSNRPYHEAMTVESAVALIEQDAGKALDPRAVEAFIRILPRFHGDAEASTRTQERPGRCHCCRKTPPETEVIGLQRHRDRARRDLRALPDRPDDGHEPRCVGHDGAHRLEADEPRAFLGVHAVLADESTDLLTCRFATGTDYELMQQLTKSGEASPAGWRATGARWSTPDQAAISKRPARRSRRRFSRP